MSALSSGVDADAAASALIADASENFSPTAIGKDASGDDDDDDDDVLPTEVPPPSRR